MGANVFDEYTDYELWQALKKGSQPAFDFLFERYVRLLYNYGRKFTADTSVIEDCVQDLFVELWERRTALSDTDSIRFYLYKSLRRRIVRARTHEQRSINRQEESDLYDFHISFSFEHTIIAAQLDAEQQKMLNQALAQLPKRQKEAILLKYFDNLSYLEIAQVMAISIDSVYKLVSGALASLKKLTSKVHLVLLLCGLFGLNE